MASSISPLGSLSFTGSSTFSSSFQQVLTRAVQIASMPVEQMQWQVSALNAQQNALSGLQYMFGALQSAVEGVGMAAQGTLRATVSDSSAVQATAAQDALAGTYTVMVDDLGSSTTTLSKAGLAQVTDPGAENISSSTSFTLTVNGKATSISPSGTSLKALAAAVNDAKAGVQATIVNVGSAASPDYRLALASDNLGADTVQLSDGTDLLDTLATGTDALYKVNGTTTDIHSSSRQVTLAPGLTVNLLQKSGQPVTITVANDDSSLQNALAGLATAYNNTVDTLGKHRGQQGGALTGESIVYSLTGVLRTLSQYGAGSGKVQSLAGLGLTVDRSGHLSFDAAAFGALDPKAVEEFLGTTASGGFLKSAGDALTAVADGSSGLISSCMDTLQEQITNESQHIADEQNRITQLQSRLQAQLAAADAVIATLEHQKSYFTDLFAAQYKINNTGTTA